MTQAFAYVLFYGIIAAASPLVLTATIAIIESDRPRTNGIAFLSGFLVGTALACLAGLIVGQRLLEQLGSRNAVEGVLVILVGVAIVFAALRERRMPPRAEAESGRGAAILAGLANVGPAAALSMAGLLGFGGPKRLALTFLAMATVSEAAVSVVRDLTLVVLYIAVSTVLVSVPIGILIATGSRGAATLQRCESWFRGHSTTLRLWLGLGVGAALIVDGLVRLVR